MTRLFPPDANATASVVSVGQRPAPIKTVGKYCPIDTAKPIAIATNIARNSIGTLICQNILSLETPIDEAAQLNLLSNARRGSDRGRKTQGNTKTTCTITRAAKLADMPMTKNSICNPNKNAGCGMIKGRYSNPNALVPPVRPVLFSRSRQARAIPMAIKVDIKPRINVV